MSEPVKTFDCAGGVSYCYGCYHMEEDKDGYGDYVLKSDYDALVSQVAELHRQRDEAAKQEPVAYKVVLDNETRYISAIEAIYENFAATMIPLYTIPNALVCSGQSCEHCEPEHGCKTRSLTAMIEQAREQERSECEALARHMFHEAATGDDIADAICSRR